MTDAVVNPTLQKTALTGAKAFSAWLETDLSNGVLQIGVKLPPERILGQRFGISRGTVRRVLAQFLQRGLITQSVGSGTFVSATLVPAGAKKPALLPPLRTSPAELMEARLLIEPLMPALIVRNATANDFQVMTNCLDQSESAATAADFEHWDGELHRSFALATHNTFFIHILELSNRVREEGEWGRLKMKSLTPERRDQYCHQHRAIVQALINRDLEQAKSSMQEHLNQIWKNLFGEN